MWLKVFVNACEMSVVNKSIGKMLQIKLESGKVSGFLKQRNTDPISSLLFPTPIHILI